MNNDEIKLILRDIGCDHDDIKSFLKCDTNLKRLKALEIKRLELLNDYHLAGRRIDCLDYLVTELCKESDSNDRTR